MRVYCIPRLTLLGVGHTEPLPCGFIYSADAPKPAGVGPPDVLLPSVIERRFKSLDWEAVEGVRTVPPGILQADSHVDGGLVFHQVGQLLEIRNRLRRAFVLEVSKKTQILL